MTISQQNANITPADTAEDFAPGGQTHLDSENPWPGLEAYEESASKFFFGRDPEANELLRLILLAPLTVVYSKSGLGKTSLLQAGLFPLLRAKQYLPVRMRLDFNQGLKDPPLTEVKRRLTEALSSVRAEYPPPDNDETLWEYLHRRDAEFWSEDNYPLTPVLVFDQFEELFSRTGGNLDLIKQVFNSLADLIENRIPPELVSQGARQRRSRLDLLSQRYRIVLCFREDFLPEIRTWERQVPSLLRNYLRLDPMSRKRAIEAVQWAGKSVLADGVAPAIVDFVGKMDPKDDTTTVYRTMVIEPVLLSLCCYQLNRRKAPGTKIDIALIEKAGQDILESFYREALEDPEVKGPPDVACFIEDYLIQGEHFRGDYPKQEALDENRLQRRQLATLTERYHLLRITHRGDTQRIELIHDRLVPVVHKAREQRRIQARQEEQERQAREAQEERDRERARSAELQQQRDAVSRSLKRATHLRNLAIVFASLCFLLVALVVGIGWFFERAQLIAGVTVNTARLAEGRLALKPGSEPMEQTIYRGLAAYRLSENLTHNLGYRLIRFLAPDFAERLVGGSQAMADSLATLHLGLDASAYLRKAIRINKLMPTPGLAYSPDGRTLAVGGYDGKVWLLDTDTFAENGAQLDCGQSSEPVWSLAFNKSGTRLAAGYSNAAGDGSLNNYDTTLGSGLICVFDLKTRSLLRKWSGRDLWQKPANVYSVAFGGSHNSEFVVSGGTDKMLRVLDVNNGEMREAAHQTDVVAVAVDADSRIVASGGDDGIIRVWDLASFGNSQAKPIELRGHDSTVEQIVFSPASPNVLVSGADDGRIIVWNAKEGCRLQQSKQQDARIYGIAVSQSGKLVAGAGADSSVRLFRLLDDVPDCRNQKGSRASSRAVEPPEFDVIKDGRLSGHGGLVLSVAFKPVANRTVAGGQRLASAGQEGSIRIWGPKTDGFSLQELSIDHPTALAIHPDSSTIAVGDESGRIYLSSRPERNAEPARLLPQTHWDAHQGPVRSLIYFKVADTWQLLSAGEDGVLKRWDLNTHRIVGPNMEDPDSPTQAIRSVALSPDGSKLASGSRDGTVRLWNLFTGELIRRIEKPKDVERYELYAVGFSLDGKYLAIGSNLSTLRVVDVDRPDRQRLLYGHSLEVKAVSRNRVGWLLSAGRDGSILQWEETSVTRPETQDSQTRDDFRYRMGMRHGLRNTRPVTAMDTSADGKLILTGGEGGQVQLWDGIEHVLIGTRFHGHQEEISAVALASDSSYFVTADSTKVLVWPGPNEWANIVCSKLSSNMSHEEWRAWVSPKLPYTAQCPELKIASDEAPHTKLQ
jgi:WD40 repeat protein